MKKNSKSDELSKLVQNAFELGASVYFEELMIPSIDREGILYVSSSSNWMTPFIEYLEKEILPEDKGKAKYLKNKASRFFLGDGQLYEEPFQPWSLNVLTQTRLTTVSRKCISASDEITWLLSSSL